MIREMNLKLGDDVVARAEKDHRFQISMGLYRAMTFPGLLIAGAFLLGKHTRREAQYMSHLTRFMCPTRPEMNQLLNVLRVGHRAETVVTLTDADLITVETCFYDQDDVVIARLTMPLHVNGVINEPSWDCSLTPR